MGVASSFFIARFFSRGSQSNHGTTGGFSNRSTLLACIQATFRSLFLFTLNEHWESILTPLLALLFLWLIPFRTSRPAQSGGDDWVRLRQSLLARELRVIGVFGIEPNADRSMASSVGLGWVGASWELYCNGFETLPSIRDYGERYKNAGLMIFPCSARGQFPLFPEQEVRSDVYVDFCKVPLQLVSPRAHTSL